MRTRVVAWLLLLIATAAALGAGGSGARLSYERALALEEANGRLHEAIALFQKVVADAGADEALAAQAQLHVGICYEKLARKEARAAYQAVVEKYPAQQDAVRLARERLARLAVASKPAPTTTVREFGRSSFPAPGKLPQPADDPSFFAVASDGETFVYSNWVSGDLVARNTASGKVKGLYGVDWSRPSEYFFLPLISRDQGRIAYANQFFGSGRLESNRLGVDSLWGGSRETLYESAADFPFPQNWSPDGSRILVSLESPDRSVALAQLDTKTRQMERLVTLNWDHPLRAEYSPDGRFIAYDSTKDGERRIYLLSADGRQERVAVDSPGEDDSPVWSPDGRFLVFRSNRSGDWDLVGIRIEKGKPSGETFLIKTNIGEATFLRGMTADGRLFYSEQAVGPEIVLVDRKGTELGLPRVLPTMKTRSNQDPAFAPDSRRLVYVAGFTYPFMGVPSLRVATLDGTVLKAITFPEGYRQLRRPLFSPAGSKIAVAADQGRQRVVLILSADSLTRLKTFTFDPGAYILMNGWSDDRHVHVLVRQGQESRIERIDVESDDRTATPFPGRNDGLSTRLSPDGEYLLMRRFPPREPGKPVTNQVIIRRLADGSTKELMNEPVSSDIHWDYDSRHFLYRKGDRLCRVSIETGGEEVLWESAQIPRLSDVSPDGRLLAFAKPGGEWRIWVVENFLPVKPAATAAERKSR